jgi:methionine synthase reductase
MRKRILILYGSETGQSEAISLQIYEQCLHQLEILLDNYKLSIDRFCLDKTEQRFSLQKEQLVIFVVSTTGEGEPPQNALKFYRRIQNRTLANDYLRNLSYTLLALGDSNYERFANFGRDLDKRLQELGAKKFYDTGFGDDAIGLEIGVEPWIHDLFAAILNHFNAYSTLKVPITEVKKLTPIETQMALKDDCLVMHSNQSLAQLDSLTLPLISSKFNNFKIKIHETLPEEYSKSYDSKKFFFEKLAVMDSDIYDSHVCQIRELTNSKDDNCSNALDKKIVLETTFQIDSEERIAYESGDSFGFIIGNSDEEVNALLDCLDLSNRRDFYCEILSPELFPHLPQICRIYDLLKYYIELRSVPKKACLRHLAQFCNIELHKRRLLELSSREGADDYNKFIRSDSVSVLDILKVFDSCKPSLEVLLANVPSFAPRYYSVVNAPNLENRNQFKIAFSVIHLEPKNLRNGSQLYGLFTGTLFQLFSQQKDEEIIDSLAKLSLNSNRKSIKIFKRRNPYFKLPSTPNVPLILIGPGTGVAPFIGFLEQRKIMKTRSVLPIGETWLFYGCRHSKLDYIYEEELKQFLSDNILTQLCICFSREITDELSPKYVQDLMLINSKSIYKLIDSKKAMVYVCGDMKMMSINVFNAFVRIVEECGQQNHENAVKYVRDMQSNKRYLQDVWL